MSRSPFPDLEPELRDALLRIPSTVLTDVSDENLHAMRTLSDALESGVDLTAGGSISVERLDIPRATGHPISAVVLRPAVASARLPVVFHLHGGGLVTGSEVSDVAWYVPQMTQMDFAVMSIGYGLAPEQRLPATLREVLDALVWLKREAPRLGFDGNRIVGAGFSAGGGLAAGMAMLARDSLEPLLSGLLLIEPMLDSGCTTASMLDPECSVTWSSTSNRFAWGAALGGLEDSDPMFEYAVPAHGRTAGLPSTYIDVGQFDLFRDEVGEFVSLLKAGGVDLEFQSWPQGFHGFQTLAPDTALAKEAARVRGSALARLLGLS